MWENYLQIRLFSVIIVLIKHLEEKTVKYGIIDVGSNTIRMVVYEINGKEIKDIANERDFAGLITYVENGVLNSCGKERILKTLAHMGEICKQHNCDELFCFATASLRNVKNIASVIEEIKQKTKITMNVISGEEEAKYDFYGLLSSVEEQNGIGFDLGGGSCQLFKFSNGKLEFFKSLKIGGQVIYKKFVSESLPKKEEAKSIYNYILKELSAYSEFKNNAYNVIYAMGGAARNAAKFYQAVNKSTESLDKFKLTREMLVFIIEKVITSPSGKKMLEEIMPERLTTLIPGIITIIAVMDYTGANCIEIVLNGVREGFLYENINNII